MVPMVVSVHWLELAIEGRLTDHWKMDSSIYLDPVRLFLTHLTDHTFGTHTGVMRFMSGWLRFDWHVGCSGSTVGKSVMRMSRTWRLVNVQRWRSCCSWIGANTCLLPDNFDFDMTTLDLLAFWMSTTRCLRCRMLGQYHNQWCEKATCFGSRDRCTCDRSSSLHLWTMSKDRTSIWQRLSIFNYWTALYPWRMFEPTRTVLESNQSACLFIRYAAQVRPNTSSYNATNGQKGEEDRHQRQLLSMLDGEAVLITASLTSSDFWFQAACNVGGLSKDQVFTERNRRCMMFLDIRIGINAFISRSSKGKLHQSWPDNDDKSPNDGHCFSSRLVWQQRTRSLAELTWLMDKTCRISIKHIQLIIGGPILLSDGPASWLYHEHEWILKHLWSRSWDSYTA